MSSQRETGLLGDWRYYMKDINSPDSFINLGFYYMIGAALQRRVWVNPPENPIFPNVYYVLTAPPGVGKGMVTREIRKCLSFHKYDPREVALDSSKTQQEPEVARLLEELKELANSTAAKRGVAEEKLLFPIPADCLTFQALTRANAEAIRRKDTKYKCALVPPSGIYTHSSMCFILEELSHLLRERELETLRYLIQAWDCETFKYDTKHQGKDIIRNTCLSLIAGTTLDVMQGSMTNELIRGGLSARMIFVVETKERQNVYRLKYDQEQLECKVKIIQHLKSLSQLFGQVTYSDEAEAFFRNYVESGEITKRVNVAPELDYYYSRKRTHMEKLAIAIHFSDNTSMEIQLPSCMKSLSTLAGLEVNMHRALVAPARNPLSEPSKKVVKLLKSGREMTRKELWLLLDGDVTGAQLEEVITFLMNTDQIMLDIDTNKYQIKI